MADIDVENVAPEVFRVTVREGASASQHRVEAPPEQVERFGGGAGAEELVRESFVFLLEREPKESILGRFQLADIARYFPEYPDVIRGRMA